MPGDVPCSRWGLGLASSLWTDRSRSLAAGNAPGQNASEGIDTALLIAPAIITYFQ
jgi:hypothetical protein